MIRINRILKNFILISRINMMIWILNLSPWEKVIKSIKLLKIKIEEDCLIL